MIAKYVEAQYVVEAQAVLLLVDGPGGEFRTQIPRCDFGPSKITFGNRTEDEITEAMNEYVATMNEKYKGKDITVTNEMEEAKEKE
jgi:hypothetical protein